jgi:methylsterol monooxygenase
VLNYTVPSGTGFLETLEGVSAFQPQLNLLERLWASYYVYMRNDAVATGLLMLLVHEFSYFGRSLPFVIMDCIPYFRQYKIQQDKVTAMNKQWEVTKSILLSHFLVEAIPIWGFHPICRQLGMQIGVPFPSLLTIVSQVAMFFVLEDAWHYWSHRLLHFGPFYRYIHKQHHKFPAPFGLTAEYAHPIEVAVLGIGTVGIPMVFVALTKNLHMLTVYIFVTLRLYQAIDAHSGYEFPWSLHHFLPFWAGADHHDEHHHFFLGNYASSFRWWDALLGTNTKKRATPESQTQAKIATVD